MPGFVDILLVPTAFKLWVLLAKIANTFHEHSARVVPKRHVKYKCHSDDKWAETYEDPGTLPCCFISANRSATLGANARNVPG
jgi:hypothetical protein